jgi:hypothetical protein
LSSPADLVVSSGTGPTAPTLLVSHPADHQRPALHLPADEFRLPLALLLRSLTRRPHDASLSRSTRRATRVRSGCVPAEPRRPKNALARGVSRHRHPSFAGAIGLIGGEIRCVGEENLTGDNITRAADRSTPVILIKTNAAVRRDFGIAPIAG